MQCIDRPCHTPTITSYLQLPISTNALMEFLSSVLSFTKAASPDLQAAPFPQASEHRHSRDNHHLKPSAAKSTLELRNPNDRLHADEPAPSLGPSTMTATAPNDISQNNCQEIIISIIIHLTPLSSPSTACPFHWVHQYDHLIYPQGTLHYALVKNLRKNK